jgi:hypothetical protein
MKHFAIEWDRDYGILHRYGWSIWRDDCCIVQLEQSLIVAILKYIFRLIKYRKKA